MSKNHSDVPLVGRQVNVDSEDEMEAAAALVFQHVVDDQGQAGH
jgi:hypothetical protein